VSDLQTTPLNDLHLRLGARMVPFAGYSMPVQYKEGVIAEHRHCRDAAALFDVSHMGQIRLVGADAAAALETMVPVDVLGLAPGRQRYGFIVNFAGGINDDLMMTRPDATATEAGFGDLLLVVNAGCKVNDLRQLKEGIGDRCDVIAMPERALLALQGPQAATALGRLNPGVQRLVFMTGGLFELAGSTCFVTRSGYTGEDGFEISVPAGEAERLALALLDQPEVKPAGLGARDTLRLEAGLCLYGHDMNVTTTPVEAGLTWAIQKVRRPGGARAGGYPGAEFVQMHLENGPPMFRAGFVGVERVPVREGARLFNAHGKPVGEVTSGTVSPTLGQPIAMGYIEAPHQAPGSEVFAEVRGKRVPMRTTAMPFTPHRYFRG
jgi:aminomethyltransferase